MEYLKRLTDVSLKRLYKFVLQRAIGRFLAEDLLLEQLELVGDQGGSGSSGSGLVVVSNLELNCDALNEELALSAFPTGGLCPVTVSRAHIDSLDAHVSYSSILFDGCKLRGKGVTIEITPNGAPCSSSSSSSRARSGSSSKNKATRPVSKSSSAPSEANYSSNEGQEGLAFIAHWVETLIARLQVEVEGLRLVIRFSSSSPNPTILLDIDKAVFYNAHPHLLDGSSVSASERAMKPQVTGPSAVGPNPRKLLTLCGFRLRSSRGDRSHHPFISAEGEMAIQLKLTADGLLEDLDVSVPCLRLCAADFAELAALLSLFERYTGNLGGDQAGSTHSKLRGLFERHSVGDAAMETILWLEKQSSVCSGEGEVDLARVTELIKRYKMAQKSPESTAQASSNLFDPNHIDVSDDELPSFEDDSEGGSDDGLLDGDFEDARDFPSRSGGSGGRVTLIGKAGRSVTFAGGAMAQSAYGESSISSNAFHSAARSKIVGSRARVASTGALKTITAQLRIANVEIRLADSSTGVGRFDCLLLKCGELVICASSSTAGAATPIRCKADISFGSASLHETNGLAGEGRLLLSFRQEKGSYSVISSPAADIRVELTIAPSKTLSVHFKGRSDPLVASAFAESISRWTPIAVSAIAGIMTSSSPRVAATVTGLFEIPSADVIVHKHPDTPDSAWCDLHDAYGDSTADVGGAWVAAAARLLDHMDASEGGVVCSAAGIRLRLVGGSAGPALEMASLACSVFLRRPFSADIAAEHSYSMREIFSVASGSAGIRVCMGSGEAERGYQQYERSFQNISELAGGVRQERDSGGMLAPPSVPESHILYFTGGEVEMDLGQRDYNVLIAVAKTLSSPRAGASGSGGFGAVLTAELALLSMSGENSDSGDTEEAFRVHLTASRPVIEMYSSDQHTYFGLIAEDFSLFEGRDDNAFLHKTSFQSILYRMKGPADVGMSAVFDRAPSISSAAEQGRCHVLGMQVLLGEVGQNQPQQQHSQVSRNARFHVDFQDVTFRYEVASNWIVQLASLLTPVPPVRVQQLRSSRVSVAGSSSSDVSCEVSAVTLRIRKCLLDYSCKNETSRTLLSIGRLKISSTIVSNSPSLSLKFSIEDFALYLSNRLASSRQLEQRPLDRRGVQPTGVDRAQALDFDRFIDENRFAQMVTVERLETLASLNGLDGTALDLRVTMDSCFLYICIDSLNLLVATAARWQMEFKELSKAQPVAAAPTAAATEQGWVKEVRAPTMAFPDPAPQPTAALPWDAPMGLDAMLLDDFHAPAGTRLEWASEGEGEGSTCSSQLMEARWLPQYDYLDADFADFDDHAVGDPDGSGERVDDNDNDNDNDAGADEGSDDDSDIERYLFDEGMLAPPDLSASVVATGGLRALSKMALGISSKMENISSLLLGPHGGQGGPEEVELESVGGSEEQQLGSDFSRAGDTTVTASSSTTSSEAVLSHTPAASAAPPFAPLRVVADDCPVDAEHNSMWPGLQQQQGGEEERAGWLVDDVASLIQQHYISLECDIDDELSKEQLPSDEKARFTDTIMTAKMSLRIRLFGGLDWPVVDAAAAKTTSTTAATATATARARAGGVDRRVAEVGRLIAAESLSRQKPLFRDTDSEAAGKRLRERRAASAAAPKGASRNIDCFLDITAKDCFLRFRAYVPVASSSIDGSRAPVHRVTATVVDLAVGFSGAGGRRKKLLGAWVDAQRPRQLRKPMAAIRLQGYTAAAAGAPVEHRMEAALTPLRCHFDAQVVRFLKTVAELSALSAAQQQPSSSDSDSAVYFQFVSVAPLQAKIDYKPSTLDLRLLQQGDYSQLLNIFPLDGLELTLIEQRQGGISGAGALVDRVLEAWVEDVYANQIHRVVSGTAPFRGLSNIGSGLHNLLLIPMGDYRKTGGVLRELRKTGGSLLGTVTREALHASHKLTMLVACALQDLVSEGGARASSGGGVREQPRGLQDGLGRAAEALAREGRIAFETVVAVPVKQYRRDGASGSLRAVIRALPVAVIRPVAGVAEAVSYTLLGLRNSLDPSQRLDEEDELGVV